MMPEALHMLRAMVNPTATIPKSLHQKASAAKNEDELSLSLSVRCTYSCAFHQQANLAKNEDRSCIPQVLNYRHSIRSGC